MSGTSTLFDCRYHALQVERALWDDGDVPDADRALSCITNELHRYQDALQRIASYSEPGAFQDLRLKEIAQVALNG